jgi:hypothetical protein
MEARFACIILEGTAVDKRKARDGAMQGWALFACLLACLRVLLANAAEHCGALAAVLFRGHTRAASLSKARVVAQCRLN